MFNPFKRKSRFNDYVVDLGKLKSRGFIKQPVDSSAAGTGSSAASGTDMGFLGSMANAASESPGSGSYGSYGASPDEIGKKISSIGERVYKILDRLDLLEHKIERIERKIGLKDEY